MDGPAITRTPVVDQIFGANRAPLPDVLSVDFADLIKAVEDAEAMAAEADKNPHTDADQAALGAKIVDLTTLFRRIDTVRDAEKKPILDAGRGIDGWFGSLKNRIEDAKKPLTQAADGYVRRKAAEARAKAEAEAAEARRRAEEERQKAEAAKTAAAAGRAEGRAEVLEQKAEAAQAAAAASVADLNRARVDGVGIGARETWGFDPIPAEDWHKVVAPLGALGPFFKREDVEAALRSMVRIQKGAAHWPCVRFRPEVKAQFRK